MTKDELSEFLIAKMKNDIDTLQQKAVDASKAGDTETCAENLRLMEREISDLSKIVEAHNKR